MKWTSTPVIFSQVKTVNAVHDVENFTVSIILEFTRTLKVAVHDVSKWFIRFTLHKAWDVMTSSQYSS